MQETSHRDLARLEAFSDGVFAIAITLLVLTLHVPADATGNPDLWQKLGGQWPFFIAYIGSFLFILIMWLNHHDFFALLAHGDRTFAILNGMLLMLIAFVPFPTALVAEYILQPAGNTATLIYGGTYVLLAVCFTGLYVYASGPGKLMRQEAAGSARIPFWRSSMGVVLYGVAALVALLNPLVSIALSIVISLLYILPSTWGISPRSQSPKSQRPHGGVSE
ncbi:MAG TPA: TMEM175 family protein [Ktedonobacterales bacterium]